MKFLKIFLLLVFLFTESILYAQPKKIRNVIMMIPDGTSTTLLSLSRWYQGYKQSNITNLPPLAIDPLICGLLRTHSSNAPIGDSAPTSSWYATGAASRAGYISMYPPKDAKNDLVDIDASKTYQPLLTVLEAAKLSGKKTGLVFTCQFPHATPADFSAHWYDRGNYDLIAKQMVHNDIDVLFGGGAKYLSADEADYLTSQKCDTITNSISRFRAVKENADIKAWALFDEGEMKYDFDRNKETEPSLAEMTGKAIRILSKNEKGFFLMVEGSKVDWAAHGNDPIGVISDFLAFDKAVDTAVTFAKNNKNIETIVVVCPDHSTGGITFGNQNSNGKYSKLTAEQLFEPLVNWKYTSSGTVEIMVENFKPDSVSIQAAINLSNPKITLTTEEVQEFLKAYKKHSDNKNTLRDKFTPIILNIIRTRGFVGFTTSGHTGEDVFLAIYDKEHNNPTGVVRSDDINRYLCSSLGLVDAKGNNTLKDSTEKYFSKHDEVFKNCNFSLYKKESIYNWNDKSKKFEVKHQTGKKDLLFVKNSRRVIDKDDVVLIVKKGKQTLEIPAYENTYYLNGTEHQLNSVVIYVDKNETFYLPKSLSTILKD
jgi:alkaline phosphatase